MRATNTFIFFGRTLPFARSARETKRQSGRNIYLQEYTFLTKKIQQIRMHIQNVSSTRRRRASAYASDVSPSAAFVRAGDDSSIAQYTITAWQWRNNQATVKLMLICCSPGEWVLQLYCCTAAMRERAAAGPSRLESVSWEEAGARSRVPG